MIEFLAYLICCLGVSYGWSDTEASRPIRNKVAKLPYINKPLLCHECSSFWISLLISLFINPLEPYCLPVISNVLSAFCGFFVNLYFTRKQIIPYL